MLSSGFCKYGNCNSERLKSVTWSHVTRVRTKPRSSTLSHVLFFSEGLISYCGFSQKQNSRQELKCIGEVLGPLVGRGQVESAYWASYHSEPLGLNPAGKIQNTCLVMVTPRDEEAGIFIPQLPRILAWGLLLRVLIPQHFQPAEVLGEKSLGMETQKQGWPVHPSPVRFKGLNRFVFWKSCFIMFAKFYHRSQHSTWKEKGFFFN